MVEFPHTFSLCKCARVDVEKCAGLGVGVVAGMVGRRRAGSWRYDKVYKLELVIRNTIRQELATICIHVFLIANTDAI